MCWAGQPQAVICTSWEREDFEEQGEGPQVKLLGPSRSELRDLLCPVSAAQLHHRNVETSTADRFHKQLFFVLHTLCMLTSQTKWHMSESARLSEHVPVQLCLRNMDFIRSIKFSSMPGKTRSSGGSFLKPVHVFTAHLNLFSRAFHPYSVD